MDRDNTYITNSTGYKLYCTYWKPKGTPRALVFISHGFAEHSQYYETLACALVNTLECFVYAHDHVGHGRSEGSKVQVDSVDTYVTDLFQHTDIIRDKYPDVPSYYIGHSMGSTIGLIAKLKRPDYFKGLMFSGTAIFTSNKAVTPFTSRICQTIGWLLPNLPLFPLDYSLPTRDPDITKERINDPLSWHGFSRTGWCSAMLKAMEEIRRNVQKIDGPLLIMHGDDDKICSIESSRLLYEKCSSTDKTIKIYPKAYHNLLDEPEGIKELVLEDVLQWFRERIESQ